MAVRLIFHIGTQTSEVELRDGVFRIGRERPAEILVVDGTVSSIHAELQVSGDHLLIRDLGSRNGTLVNGTLTRTAKEIGPSDDVRVGAVRVEVKPPAAAAASPGVSLPPVREKLDSVRASAALLSWGTKLFLAGSAAIILLAVLISFAQIYANSVAKRERIASRFATVAAQYAHDLERRSSEPLRPPVADLALQHLLIADDEGKIVFPSTELTAAGERVAIRSPLINPETKRLFQKSKWDLFEIPRAALRESDPQWMSFPVRSGSEVVGYVIADPSAVPSPGLGPTLMLLALAVATSLIVLLLLQRRILAPIREQFRRLTAAVGPFANGYVESLPRSEDVPELSELASSVETTVASLQSGAGTAKRGDHGPTQEFASMIADLVVKADEPFCIVDGDFRLLFGSPALEAIEEFRQLRQGTSLFEAGLTAIQSKQLIQTISEARRAGTARGRVALQRSGDTLEHVVTVTTFTSGGAPMFGMIFTAPVAK